MRGPEGTGTAVEAGAGEGSTDPEWGRQQERQAVRGTGSTVQGLGLAALLPSTASRPPHLFPCQCLPHHSNGVEGEMGCEFKMTLQ